MKKTVIGFLFLLCHFVGAQQLDYSDIRISLLTADPGEEIYMVFGHSAIRVKIESFDYDAVYNYGTFNFNQPNFAANFARGRMLYFLSLTTYDHFMASYIRENRGMREQVFKLDSAQTMFMLQFLENNYRPENRYYLYHFFLDNCATRIRDLIIKIFEGISLPETHETPTFRELIHRYLKQHPWGRFGIDIALGLPTDQKTDVFEQMFLPDYLHDVFAKMSHDGRPIVGETKVVFAPDPNRPPAQQPPGLITPMVVCCFILALALFFSFFARIGRKTVIFFDFILFFTVGLVGLLVIFLWFFTEHTFTQNNLNIIWALPTHVIMAFFLLPKRRNDFIRKYFLATAVIAMLLVITWIFLPQPLHPALIPLVLAVALRGYRIKNEK